MSSKNLDEISKSINNLKFKRVLFGGVSEEDVLSKLKELNQDYYETFSNPELEANQITKNKAKRADRKLNEKKRAARTKAYLIVLGIKIVSLLVLFLLIFGLFVGVTAMKSGDMYPKINAGDLLIYSKIGSNYSTNDVVVIKKDKEKLCGRVVGLPGQTIEIGEDYRLYVNGEKIVEDDIFYETPKFMTDVKYPITLGENEYFILCDFRESAVDSRTYGVVTKKEIKGKVKTIIRRSGL